MALEQKKPTFAPVSRPPIGASARPVAVHEQTFPHAQRLRLEGSELGYVPMQQSVLAKRPLPQPSQPNQPQELDYRSYRAILERTAAQQSYYGMNPESNMQASERGMSQQQRLLYPSHGQQQPPGQKVIQPSSAAYPQSSGFPHQMGAPIMQPIHHNPYHVLAGGYSALPSYANKDNYQSFLYNRALETAQKNVPAGHYSMPYPQQQFMYQETPVSPEAMHVNGRLMHPSSYPNARDIEMIRGSMAPVHATGSYPQRAIPNNNLSYHVAGGTSDRQLHHYMTSANHYQAMNASNAQPSYVNVDDGMLGSGGFGSPFLNKQGPPVGAVETNVPMHGASQAYLNPFITRPTGFDGLSQQPLQAYPQHLQQPLSSQPHENFGVDSEAQL